MAHSPILATRAFRLIAAIGLVVSAACHGSPAATASTATTAAVVSEPLRDLPAPLYGANLPDRLDDSTFWRLSAQLSEPGGYFRSENFVSNEMGLQHVIGFLSTQMPPGGAYVGVGPEQNFTYIGALKPRIAFIVDIRRQNLLQHLWYKAVFELSPNRAQFLARLFGRPAMASAPSNVSADSLLLLLNLAKPDTNAFRKTFADVQRQLTQRHGFAIDTGDLRTLRYVDSIFFISGPRLNYSSGSASGFGGGFGGGMRGMPTFAEIMTTTTADGRNIGFLGSEETYGYVRDLERRNLLVPVVGDFGGPKAVRAVGAWLRDHGAKVNAFYLSNVEQYLFPNRGYPASTDDPWAKFYASVGTMPLDSTSRFIRSATNGFNRGGGFAFNANGPRFMMQQLTSSMMEIVAAARDGQIREYGDVIGRSRP